MAGELRHRPGHPPGRALRSCTPARDFPVLRPRGLPSRRRRVARSPPRARVPKSASLLRLASGDKQLRGTAPLPVALEAAVARVTPAR